MSAATQLEDQGASPEEAAAIVAAIEHFVRDTASSPPRSPARASGWLRTLRLEEVGVSPDELGAWGDPHPWGRPPD